MQIHYTGIFAVAEAPVGDTFFLRNGPPVGDVPGFFVKTAKIQNHFPGVYPGAGRLSDFLGAETCEGSPNKPRTGDLAGSENDPPPRVARSNRGIYNICNGSADMRSRQKGDIDYGLFSGSGG